METSANSEAIEAWNTVLFDKFCRFRHLVTTGLGIHGDAVLARHPPRPGMRVLDIGCGFGDTTLVIAQRVGRQGQAVGVDAAPRFIEAATHEAAETGAQNAQFMVKDVQSDPLGGPYDQAFSRFGTMFFANPVAALRNVRRALAPGAKLAIVVWRRREDNPWLYLAEQRVRTLVPEPEQHTEPTCGPGPFSMAGADTVSDILRGAGYADITLERSDADICIGQSLEEAVEFAMALGPAGEIMRLAGVEAEKHKPEVIAALREVFSVYARPDGIIAPSSTWIVSARAP